MAEEGKVSFKKSAKKRPARSKAEESPSEDEEINTTDFEKTKQLQRLRKRTAGTNIVTLALGKKISKIDQDILEDPFQLNSGGLVLMKDMKGYKTKQDAYDVGTQFYKETHIRDEDDEMKRFIDTEMEKIKGVEDEVGEEEDQPKYLSPEDAALQVGEYFLRGFVLLRSQTHVAPLARRCPATSPSPPSRRTSRCCPPRCSPASQRWTWGSR